MSQALQNNNPGNLKYIGQEGAAKGTQAADGGYFAKFNTPDEGYVGLMNDIHSKITGATSTGLTKDKTLSDFAGVYAPPGSNDSDQYVLDLANKLGTPPDTKLGDLESRVPELAKAISEKEDNEFAKQYPLDAPSKKQDTGYVTSVPLTKPTGEPKPEVQGSEQPLLGQVQGRAGDISEAAKQTFEGKINPISGLLQVAGGVAGGFGDVVNKVIEKTPIVGDIYKGLENLIGGAVGSLANTEAGKAILKPIAEAAKAHPEAFKNIGAGINIISAIPILKGLGVIKNVALDSISSALKNTAEKAISRDLTATVSRLQGGRNLLEKNPNSIQKLIDERALPEINGKNYSMEKADDILETSLDAQEAKLQNVLKSQTPIVKGKPVISVEQARQAAIKSATEELEGTADFRPAIRKINNMFDDALKSSKSVGGETQRYLTLDDANVFKRRARTGLKWDDTVGKNAGYHVSKAYMTAIEDVATKYGLGDVHLINKEMGELLEAQKLIPYIDTKKAPTGLVQRMAGEGVADAATVAGEAVGRGLGVPYAGAIASRSASRMLGEAIPKKGLLQRAILNRTGKGAIKTTSKQATSGLIKMGSALQANRISR